MRKYQMLFRNNYSLLAPLLFVLILLGPAQALRAQNITDAQYEQLRQALMKDKGHLSQKWDNYDTGNPTSCADSTKKYHHPGVDYGTSEGTPIYSPVSGTVIRIRQGADCHNSTTNCLSIMSIYNPESDKTYTFLHMKSFYFSENDHVDAGKQIGLSGWRGVASAPHLHYEVRKGKKVSAALCVTTTIDPYQETFSVGNPTPIGPPPSWEFNTDHNFEGWRAINISDAAVHHNILFVDPAAGDFYLLGPAISVDASVFKYLQLRMASNAGDQFGKIYFRTQSEDFSETKTIPFQVHNCPPSSCNGNAPFVDYDIYLGANPRWTGTITGIRLDPANNGTGGTNKDSIGIDYIRLIAAISASTIFEPLPPFSVEVSLTPSSPVVNQPLTLGTTITNLDDVVDDLYISTEIYDSNGQRVFQNIANHQDFLAEEAKTVSLNWIPSTAGLYTVKVEVSSSDQLLNYFSNSSVKAFDVGTTPLPNPTRHSIRGRITDRNGNGVAGVEVLFGAIGFVNRPGGPVTDSSGYFEIPNLQEGYSWYLAPQLNGHYFIPRSMVFPPLTGDQTANFFGPASPSPAPYILTEENSTYAATVDSVTQVAGPLPLNTQNNFSSDGRTRFTIFVSNMDLPPGESFSASDIFLNAESPLFNFSPVVENFGKARNIDGLNFITVMIPDYARVSGDIKLRMFFLGVSSNQVTVSIKPSQ
jgi:murein DD-endopeptidase MepM/ murein hydrolase activator NlpD